MKPIINAYTQGETIKGVEEICKLFLNYFESVFEFVFLSKNFKDKLFDNKDLNYLFTLKMYMRSSYAKCT
jgi:hypothetical protein